MATTHLAAPWTMTVPVISTAHMPSEDAFHHLPQRFTRVAEFPEGFFVYVGTNDPAEWDAVSWFQRLLTWFRTSYGPDQGWIRFDHDGDKIEGLDVFDW